MPDTARPPQRAGWRRWMRRALWATGGLMLAFLLFVGWAYLFCFAEPPTLAAEPSIRGAAVTTGPDGRRRIGASWFWQRPGRSLLSISGDPFTLGYSNAALTEDLLEAQERTLMETVREKIPGDLPFYGVALMVLVHNRNLPDYVHRAHQEEIFGLASCGSDSYPQFGSRYHRILNYHAAHDISHWVHDVPAVGCTAFAAGGARTADRHLLVGRNFDWESGAHFDTNKVIALYRPDTGTAFLSVSWPGMAGAVTGLNAKKIYCSLNGAHTEHMGLGVGRPVSLVVRDVLQHADSLDAAIEIIRRAPVFVADSFLVADGRSGTAVVVEKSPAQCAVRPMAGGWILQANHFETAAMVTDQGNLTYMRDGTSVSRHRRLGELLAEESGRLSPTSVARILRDRRGAGGADWGLGHRGTLNPMIATHAVVADVTAGTLWVSRGRHQLGVFDGYTIDGFGADRIPPIPADPSLEDGTYERLRRYRAILETLEPRMAAGRFDADSRGQLAAAAKLNPRAPEVLAWRAQSAQAAGDRVEALRLFRAARDAHPPFRRDRRSIDAAIQQLEENQ